MITINMFRDCKNSTVQFDKVIKIGIHVNNNNKDLYRVRDFNLLIKKRVTPPGSAFCDFYPKNICIEQAFYEGTIELQPNSSGYHITFVRCCRNVQSNLVDNDGTPYLGQTFYCKIPDPSLKNNSPIFSGVPSPFMCNLDTNQFLFTGFDIDGDSLVYKTAFPYAGGSPTINGNSPDPEPQLKWPIEKVIYKPGFDPGIPFGNSGYLWVDPGSGYTEMYSPTPGSYVVAVEVIEYRKGKEIGRVRLDMQILVLDCKGNNKPKASSPLGKYFEIEGGEKLCFQVKGYDKDDDNITIRGIGEIFGDGNLLDPPYATIQQRTSQTNVTSEFCWTPSCDQPKNEPYAFFVNVTDDGCPQKFDNLQIKIKVNKFTGNENILGKDPACKNAVETYSAETKKPKSSFWWEVIGGKIVSDSTGQSIDVQWSINSIKGKIRSVEISEFGCPADTIEKDIDLLDNPALNPIQGNIVICEGSKGVLFTVTLIPGNTYKWLTDGGFITSNNANTLTVDFPIKGKYTISLIETNSLGCVGDTNKLEIEVIRPDPIITGPLSVCPNRTGIEYEIDDYQAGSSFAWTISGGTKSSGGNGPIITVDWGGIGAGSVSVIETNSYGCKSFISIVNVLIDHNLKGQQPIGESSVCEDETKNYFVYKSKGSVYSWTVTGGTRLDNDSLDYTSVHWGTPGLGRIGVMEKSYDSVNNIPCLSPLVYEYCLNHLLSSGPFLFLAGWLQQLLFEIAF